MDSFQELVRSIDWGSLTDALLRVLGVFICLTVHETCHGLAALALGDPTAKREHRLSLNPLHHIDWFGLAAMLLVGFGWAKPVPVDMRYFKKPKQGMALTALAGPVSNLLLAVLLLLGARLTLAHYVDTAFCSGLLNFLAMTAYMSIGLGLFNLIPISPLDGSKVLFAFLPDRAYLTLMRYEKYGMAVLFVLVWLGVGDNILSEGNPVFKLEGVVHERSVETLQDFEGPLDLILFLLSKNKIEIQDIPIALILDQYLAYLEQRKQLDLEVASEFITMAAHLMYIKTRMLLSLEDEQAQSEMDELIASLKERAQKDTYLRIKLLTKTLGPMGEFGCSITTRDPEPMKRGKVYEYSHEKADLVLAMQAVFDRSEKLAAPPSAALSEIVRREPYPVKGKAEEILHRLKEFGMTRFRLLFRGSRSRSEIVATFIAVLELCREKVIHLAGSDTDCTVECGENTDEHINL